MTEMNYECIKSYQFPLDGDGHIIDSAENDPSQELNRLTYTYMSEHNVSYRVALERVLDSPENEELLKSYNETHPAANDAKVNDGKRENVSKKLYELAVAYMAETGEESLSNAANAVLAENERLRKAYSLCFGSWK